jgi:hypothetical protein
MQRLAALVASAVCISSSLHAQEPRAPRGPGPIAESASRIAQEWWPTEPRFFTIDEEGRPRFRAVTSETLPPPPWQLSPEIPLTPARGAISHQEMLRVMTPQVFSSPLIGGSVDPGSLYNGMKKAWREWQARRIHEQVVKELEEFKRMQAAAGEDDDH